MKPKSRWLAYTWQENVGDARGAPQAIIHTTLVDLSKAGFPREDINCVAGLFATNKFVFSPDGKWLSCDSGGLYDISGEHPLSVDPAFANGVWAPDSRWVAHIDSTNLSFSQPQVAHNATPVTLGTLLGCSGGTWSPGGQLFAFSCAGSVYVVSPRWSTNPLAPVLIGTGTFLGFVSDQVLTLRMATGALAWSRVVGQQASALAQFNVSIPMPSSSSSAPIPELRNSEDERAVFVTASGKRSLVDFRTGHVEADVSAAPGLKHFVRWTTGSRAELLATSMPVGPALGTLEDVAEILSWSADGRVFVSRTSQTSPSGSGFQLTWLAPTVHSELLTESPQYPAPAVFGANDAWVVFPNAQLAFTVANLDPVAGHIVKKSAVSSPPGNSPNGHLPPFVSGSGHAFAYESCVVGVTDAGPAPPACLQFEPALNVRVPWDLYGSFDGTNGKPPPVSWSSDSAQVVTVTYTMTNAFNQAYGLVVAPANDPSQAVTLLRPNIGIQIVRETLLGYGIQP